MLHTIPNWVDEVRASHAPHYKQGTARLIDAEALMRGIAAVTEGRSVSVSRIVQNANNAPAFARSGFGLKYSSRNEGRLVVARDELCCDNHGMVNTHIDGINHFGLDGIWHDGSKAVTDENSPCIADWADEGLVTRGVFLDIPALRGDRWVAGDQPVSAAEMEAATKAAGVELRRGDAVLLYMGRTDYEAAGHRYNAVVTPDELRPGIGMDGARWLADQQVSMVLWDFMEATGPGESPYSVHVLIWAMGLILIDNCDFADLRKAIKDRKQKAGLLTVAPLKLEQATGCMVNPLLII